MADYRKGWKEHRGLLLAEKRNGRIGNALLLSAVGLLFVGLMGIASFAR